MITATILNDIHNLLDHQELAQMKKIRILKLKYKVVAVKDVDLDVIVNVLAKVLWV